MLNITIEGDISYKNIKTEENNINKIKKRKIHIWNGRCIDGI